MEEASAPAKTSIKQEIDGYGHETEIVIINRDGDLYYAECPECHNMDLKQKRLLLCKSCGMFFQPYYEDGCDFLWVMGDGKIMSYRDEIKLFQRKPEDAWLHIFHPRNENKKEKLMKEYPNGKFITIYKDLHKDEDAHGHHKYRKYVLIPIP